MELLEAATRSDNPELAELALERIVAATSFARTDSAQGILARSRALVSEGASAERLYDEAIERLGRSLLRPELARAHLLYGEWLRREGRRVDARDNCASPTTSSRRSAWKRSPSAPAASCWPRARRSASGQSRREMI